MNPLQKSLTANVKEDINTMLERFRQYLINNYSQKYAVEVYYHASMYGYDVLFNGDMAPLFQMNESKRADVMKALSLLSKFLGRYEEWIKLKNMHGLRWASNNNTFPLLSAPPLSKLVEQAKKLIDVLSIRFMHEVRFMAMSGVRVEESLNAIKIYKTDKGAYLDNGLMILEHFKYPRAFFRKNKKIFITVLDDEMLGGAGKLTGHNLQHVEMLSPPQTHENLIKCFPQNLCHIYEAEGAGH